MWEAGTEIYTMSAVAAPEAPEAVAAHTAAAAAGGVGGAEDATAAAAADNASKLYHLCFDPDEFDSEENFSAAAFLVEKRRYVPIDTLVRDLTSFRGHLQEEVVRLVNTEVYDTFLSVTNKLYQREQDLLRLQAPLHDVAARVTSACGKLEASKEKVEEKLSQIEALQRRKAFALHKLRIVVTEQKMRSELKAFHAAEQSEAAAAAAAAAEAAASAATSAGADPSEKESSPSTSPPASPSAAAQQPQQQRPSPERLEALGTIVHHAKELEANSRFLLPSVDAQKQEKLLLCARVAQLRTHVQNVLGEETARLLRRFKGGDASSDVVDGLRVCFEGYNELEEEAACLQVFKKCISDASAEETVSWGAASASRDNPEAMQTLFQVPIQLCTERWRVVTDVAHETGIVTMVTSLWQSFSDTFSKRMPFLFEYGNANVFARRYEAAHTFAAALEGICKSRKALVHLRKDMKLWESRWNLEVYARMREMAATSQLGKWGVAAGDLRLLKAAELLHAAAVPPPAPAQQQQGAAAAGPEHAIELHAEAYVYGPCAAADSVVAWAVSEEVLLGPLVHKFLALALGVMDTLKTWHVDFLRHHEFPVLDESGALVSGARRDSRATKAVVEGKDDVEVLLLLYLDLSTLKGRLREGFAPSVLARFEESERSVAEAASTVVDSVLAYCSLTAHELSATITSIVTLQCTRPLLDYVQNLPTQFRRTKKPCPTKANTIITIVLEKLAEFRRTQEKSQCPQEVVDGMTEPTVSFFFVIATPFSFPPTTTPPRQAGQARSLPWSSRSTARASATHARSGRSRRRR